MTAQTDAVIPNKPPAFFRTLMKIQNPVVKRLLKSPLHVIVSGTFMLITFTGRKSGTVYTTPVQYRRVEDTVYIITSAGYTWWKNLRGGADVHLRIRGRAYAGHAQTCTDAEDVDAIFAKVYPGFNAERRAGFVPGKVGIKVELKEGAK